MLAFFLFARPPRCTGCKVLRYIPFGMLVPAWGSASRSLRALPPSSLRALLGGGVLATVLSTCCVKSIPVSVPLRAMGCGGRRHQRAAAVLLPIPRHLRVLPGLQVPARRVPGHRAVPILHVAALCPRRRLVPDDLAHGARRHLHAPAREGRTFRQRGGGGAEEANQNRRQCAQG